MWRAVVAPAVVAYDSTRRSSTGGKWGPRPRLPCLGNMPSDLLMISVAYVRRLVWLRLMTGASSGLLVGRSPLHASLLHRQSCTSAVDLDCRCAGGEHATQSGAPCLHSGDRRRAGMRTCLPSSCHGSAGGSMQAQRSSESSAPPTQVADVSVASAGGSLRGPCRAAALLSVTMLPSPIFQPPAVGWHRLPPSRLLPNQRD